MAFDAVSRHTSKMLSLEAFKVHIKREGSSPVRNKPGENNVAVMLFPEKLPTIKQATEMLVEEAVTRARGNQSVAAQILGISQPALSKRLKKRDKLS